MHRTTKLVLALAGIITVLLGVGALQYAWLELKPSAPPTLGQGPAPASIPTTSPSVAPPAAPSPAPPSAVPAAPATGPAMEPPTGATTVTYVVQPHDTLWDLARTHLGNPLRWQELYDLNRGRPQPGGQALVNSSLICPGWTLEFPAQAEAFSTPQAPGASSGGPSA